MFKIGFKFQVSVADKSSQFISFLKGIVNAVLSHIRIF